MEKALGSGYTAKVESNEWTFLIDSGLGKRSRWTVQGMYSMIEHVPMLCPGFDSLHLERKNKQKRTQGCLYDLVSTPLAIQLLFTSRAKTRQKGDLIIRCQLVTKW